ncbi:Ig-like domain-containing protein [Pyxidicoccus fallax]|uniref:SbsA Ig-like domain-containing protein n=1 Tax=Pyxidicoccus fallax TaxID=394095 RepID=A0A848LMP4_9BACT|nr:Ig-like domain-containing protein [Pyxidicoccus fallax]NMO19006.1 hypothetical protein [Pyxidicoccus fallax]NPC86097.1 Ig-like domain-containing protein [Pyxidicoccus fallax]
MNRLRILVTWCLFTCAACIDLPEVVDPLEEPLPEPRLEVRLASPGEATSHTNGDVPVQVVVSGGEAETVELLLGDEVLVRLSPPYSYTWSTQGVPEGRYSLAARATRKGEGFTSEVRTVVVDRTPPQVVSRTPAPGAQDVSVRAPIRIEFSEPLLRSSVTEASFSVTAGDAVLGFTMNVAADFQSVEISLVQSPPVPTALAVTVSPLVTDVAGNMLGAPTGVWSWHSPAFIPASTQTSASIGLDLNSSMSLAFDALTQAPLLAWSERIEPFGSDVFVRRWNGSEWVDLGMLPHLTDTSRRSQPHLLAMADGRILVGFLDYGDDNTPRVVVAELVDGSWRQVGLPFWCIPMGGQIQSFFMTLGENQQPIVALNDRDTSAPTERRVYVCRFKNGKWEAVGSPLGASGVGQPASLLGVGADAAGNPVVLWSQGRALTLSQWSGTQWMPRGGGVQLNPDEPLIDVSLTMSQKGIPFMAWTVHRTDGSELFRAARDTLVNPIGAGVLTSAPQVHVGRLFLKLGAQEQPIVFWSEHDNTNGRHSLHMKKWLGSQWEDARLVAVYPANAGGVALAVDEQGEILCAHPENDGQRNVISLKRFNR